MKHVHCFDKNTKGRDFVIGDIHAHKKRFLRALESVDFDKSKDRLFCVGDLVDRGKYPLFILDCLREGWLFAVRGNHEQMIIDRFENPIAKPPYMSSVKTQHEAAECHRGNGGKWFDKLLESAQENIYNAVSALPFAITLETESGQVGIVHAEVPEEFDDWLSFLEKLDESASVRNEAIWNRLAIESNFNVETQLYWREFSPEFEDAPRFIDGINAVVHGHTPVKEVIQCGNQFWIDTGYISNELTILEANSLIERVQKP
jgi:serine/threonine protein phosphatase 1